MRYSAYPIAVMVASIMLASVAMAGSVDIGLGRMDQAEFDTLKRMVSGEYRAFDRVPTARPQSTRVAEFNQADLDEIRQVMAAGDIQQNAPESSANDAMVDIGTGEMAAGDFCDLNKLVASNHANSPSGFRFLCP